MSARSFFWIFLMLLPLAACRPTPAGERLRATLEHDGIERTYHIYLPSNFSVDDPLPLVLALHGGGGQGNQFDQGATQGTLTTAAEERGVVLVFPEGIDKQWCDGRFSQLDTERQCDTIDDVAFISEIIDTMVQEYGIDPTRVYATGISNGGFMSVRLAMDLSDKIAAVAPVAAQLSVALEDNIPKLPISMMIINGTEDPIVPYDGGEVRLFESGRSRGEVLATAVTIEHFRQHNNCEATPKLVELLNTDPDDGTTVTIETYFECDGGAEVILVKVIGGGHTWPGGKQYLGPKLVGVVSREINASDMILDFFLAHSR